MFIHPFGAMMRPPPWMSPDHPVFTGELAIEVRVPFITGGFVDYRVMPRFDEDCCTWLFETLVMQAYVERWKRGLQIMDDRNRFLEPAYTPDGYPIIEETEQVDGSATALFAAFGNGTLPEADLREWDKVTANAGVYRRYAGPFKRLRSNPPGAQFKDAPPGDLRSYWLTRPVVASRMVRNAEPDRNPYAPRSTVHGSAQWAWRDELLARKIIAEDGSFVGHTFLGRARHAEGDGRPPRLDHIAGWGSEGHRLIVGPPGTGKFYSAIAPLLLTAPHASVFALDVKNGEMTKVSARARRATGPVVILDPFGIAGMPGGGINPLDMIRPDNPRLVTAAARLAEAIYIPDAKGEDHWDRSARKLLTALLLHVGTGDPIAESGIYANAPRTLRTLRNIVRDRLPPEIRAAMYFNDHADGAVSAEARAIAEAEETDADAYRFYILDALEKNIEFLQIPEVLAVCDATVTDLREGYGAFFDVRDLKHSPSTLFLVVPDHEIKTVNRWVRLIYAFVMEEMREARGGTPVHVIIDEFAALGRFDRVADDMARTRSLGIHMHIVVQSLGQLHADYGEGWQRLQGTTAVTHVLGARDNFTAAYISKLLGQTTEVTDNTSTTRSPGGGSQSKGVAYVGRALMTPDELLRMKLGESVVIIGGMNPMRLAAVPYVEGFMKDLADPIEPASASISTSS